MAELSTLARPYARAAFAVAQSRSAAEQWSNALTALAEASAHEQVGKLIGHPSLSREAAIGLLTAAVGEIPEGIDNLLALLGQNGRLKLLPAIAGQFEALRAEAEKTQVVVVTSAAELGDAQRKAVVDGLGRRLSGSANVDWQVDPELVGGMTIRAGDLLIDSSLRGELDRLRSALLQ